MRLIDADALYSRIEDLIEYKDDGAYKKGRNNAFHAMMAMLHDDVQTPTIEAKDASVMELTEEQARRLLALTDCLRCKHYSEPWGTCMEHNSFTESCGLVAEYGTADEVFDRVRELLGGADNA